MACAWVRTIGSCPTTYGLPVISSCNYRAVIERERERDCTNAVPPHLRRDVFRSRRYGLHAWRFLFQFGRALMRIIREHSLGSRCSGNPTDVRPRDASLVVSQASWICSLQVGRPRSTADLAAGMNISRHQFDSNSIPPDHRNGTLPTDLAE